MKTEFKLIEELKLMMSEMPLEEISVSMLAKRCHVKRQTFYYHFHDIYDLLTLVFLHEKIERINKVTNPQDLVTVIFNYYVKNQDFLDAALISAGRDLFSSFINNACQTAFNKLVADLDPDKKLAPTIRKNIARFFAHAYSNTISFYLISSKKKELDGLLKQFNFLGPNFLKQIVEKQMK